MRSCKPRQSRATLRSMRFANDIATIRRGLQARLGDHYSQRAVAARVGVSPNTLSRWEKYALMPSAMAAVTLARDLGVTVEQLGFRRVESPKGSG